MSDTFLKDLEERLEQAARALDGLNEDGFGHPGRLTGKAEGVRLALSYLREIQSTPLAEAWELGLESGVDFLAQCCGCSGKGQPPTNPFARLGD